MFSTIVHNYIQVHFQLHLLFSLLIIYIMSRKLDKCVLTAWGDVLYSNYLLSTRRYSVCQIHVVKKSLKSLHLRSWKYNIYSLWKMTKMIICLSVYKSVNRLIVAAPLPLAIIRFNGLSGEERLCVIWFGWSWRLISILCFFLLLCIWWFMSCNLSKNLTYFCCMIVTAF